MLETPLWFLCWWPMLPHPVEGLGYADFFCTSSVCGFQFSRSGAELEQFPRRAGWPVWGNQDGRPSGSKPVLLFLARAQRLHHPTETKLQLPASVCAVTETPARIVTLPLHPSDKHRAWWFTLETFTNHLNEPRDSQNRQSRKFWKMSLERVGLGTQWCSGAAV